MDSRYLLFERRWYHTQYSTAVLALQTSEPCANSSTPVLSSQDAIPTRGAERSMDMLGSCGVASLVQYDVGRIVKHLYGC